MKNHSTTVSAIKSITIIEKHLAEFGAINISKQYEKKKIKSIFFQIDVKEKIFSFKLPANIEAAAKILKNKVKRPNKNTDNKIKEQAEKTAWKIMSEWVQIQITLIEMEQAEFMELFLAYVFNNDKTFYQQIKNENFKLLTE